MAFHKARALQAAEKSVAQGKIAQAIKQYQEILDSDPADVSLFNTIGDLYVRDRNLTEALRQFRKLAEAYVREGFNVRAIAIYKKISKVDPNSVDTLLKLAELYQLQGLSREARDQYLQAAEFFKKRNQAERALEVLYKLVQFDPENIKFRTRLAAEYEQTGKREDAAKAYLESAEIMLRRDDPEAAKTALKKAAELTPENSTIQMLLARVAITLRQPEEAERVINSSPVLQSDPEGKRILLDSYLGTRKLPEAEKLVREVFRANSTDFGPVSSVSALLVENADFDKAYQLLASVAEPLIRQNNAGPLLEALRRIWNKSPKHIPTLELIHRICERTADELTLPEALEALGRAHEQAGDLEKAEAAYLKLIEREPDNENYRGLLNAVQQKLGKKVKPENFSGQGMVLGAAEEPPRQAAGVDAIQEVMVKDALENSDLFARYNLREKAIAELEKVLQVYPDQIEVLQRILEISRKGNMERGAAAAAHLARMYAERGDVETANKYQAIADAKGPVHEIPLLPSSAITKGEGPVRPSPAPPERPGAGMAPEIPIPVIAPEEPVTAAAAPPPDAVSLDVTPPGAPSEPPVAPPPPPVLAEQTMELDLSEDLESLVAFSFEAPPPSVSEPPSAPGEKSIPAELEESRIEVEFYLENGLVDEARQVMAEVEEKYPGGPLVSELRWRLDQQAAEAPPVESPASAVPTDEAAAAELQIEVVQAEPEAAPPPAPAPVAEEPTHEEWELPSEYAVPPQPEPATDTVVPPLVTEPEASPPVAEFTAPPPAPMVEQPVVYESSGLDILGELARDLASSLDGLIESSDAPPAGLADSPMAVVSPPADPAQGAAQLDGLLAEMEEAGAAETAKDDPETHYNLGVAFREMGLLDEAIGEFQKVVKGSGKENYPSNFLQACSLLAICFMEKKMPAIAVKWYGRALETPGLEEEALMALQYDLGLAYEEAGDSRSALERFTEVYSQNIDFRDVADKIRELQQKA